MDTGTCSRRSVFRNGSCSNCPLLLTICSVFSLLLELAHYHSDPAVQVGSGGYPDVRPGARNSSPGAVRAPFGPPQSLSAYGFLLVFISMRSGVPMRSNSLRNRPSRKRLYE